MKFLWVLIAVLAGAGMPFQAGVNATLRRYLGGEFQAAMVNFLGGVVVIFLIAMTLHLTKTRDASPDLANAANAPWWAWIGGIFGATLVVSAIVVIPHLGAAGLLIALVAGQMISSIVVDHFGLVGQPVRPVSPARMIAVALLVGAVVLIQREPGA